MSNDRTRERTHYTASDQNEADRLLDRYPTHVVAEKTGIPKGTLKYWIKQGYVTKPDHRYGPRYDEEVIEQADTLYDEMPISKVADALDVSESTLWKWARKGWVDTEVDWQSEMNKASKRNRKRARKAAHLVYDQNLSQREAAEKLGVSQPSVSRYLKMYRHGAYSTPELKQSSKLSHD